VRWVSGVVWVVWIAGRWLTFSSDPIHGERHPCVAAFRGVTQGPGLPERGPYAADRGPPTGGSATSACGPVPGGLTVGAIGWLLVASRYAGGAAAAGRARLAPSRVNTNVLSAPPGAFGRRGCRVKPRRRVTSGRNKVSG